MQLIVIFVTFKIENRLNRVDMNIIKLYCSLIESKHGRT